ncbi:MAG: hypothetical protein ACFFD2_10640 [Promethearchaeota archaeon]
MWKGLGVRRAPVADRTGDDSRAPGHRTEFPRAIPSPEGFRAHSKEVRYYANTNISI